MRSFGLAALSGLLYCAAFPPIDAGAVAWIALVPLIVAARDASVARGGLLGWVTGTIACNGLTSASILTALGRAGHPPWLAGIEAFVIPQVCGAIYFGAFGAYVAALARVRGVDGTHGLAVAAAWTASELLRSRIGHGMPWVLLGHSQTDWPIVVQIADLAGAFGVSFVVALVNAAIAGFVGFGQLRARGWPATLTAAAVLAATLAYGRVQLGRWETPSGQPVDVGLVQGGIPAAWRTSLAHLPDVLGRYRALVGEVSRERNDLVILPENAAGITPGADARIVAAVTAPLAGSDTQVLFGAPRTVSLSPSRATTRNSAYLVDAAGRTLGLYDKQHLVPFGEASTWLLPSRLAEHLGLADDYSPGETPTLFRVRDRPFATLICWEGIYATAAARAVRDGATFLVNLSNDDWFDGRAAREQHFRATLLRAVESRRYLVRVTNSGVTAVVDPRGIRTVTVPYDVPVVTRARIMTITGRTVYVRAGDAFGGLCALMAVALLLWRLTASGPTALIKAARDA